MRPSRRQLAALQQQNDQLTLQNAHLRHEVTVHAREAEALASALIRSSGERDRVKDVVASHIAAVGHPNTVLHDVHEFTGALQQALKDAGVDLTTDVLRLKGGAL
ncbi:hypothetical protein [Streptomyces antibioticus]|uniref:hypothetical protein n=1 Tax=Streptomyces antibioticus TaxID=1890 RepID=UPI0036F95699